MALVLGPPPRPPRTRSRVLDNYLWELYRWWDTLYRTLGQDSGNALLNAQNVTGVVGVTNGGTGGTNAAAAAAALAPSSAVTQTKTVSPTLPATLGSGDSANTVVTWDAAFATAGYDVTAAFTDSRAEAYRSIAILAGRTVNDVTIEVSNDADLNVNILAGISFQVQVTGVHP